MPARIDRNSPEYKKELYAVAVIVAVLTLVGGFILGYKINRAEEARASGEMQRTYENERGKVPGPEHGIMQ